MFIASDSTIVSQLAAEFELDIYEKAMISSFVKMKPGQREFVRNWVKAAIKEILDDETAHKEFRAEYDKEHALPFAARGGDTSGLAEAVELFDSAFSAAEGKENKDGM